jgi:CHAT domain-containing protein
LESFLALAGGDRLAAVEIYEMNLSDPLVVLSACRSASGPISTDGVLGLTRAFFAAGASSVIASAWDVPDEPASILMAEFYAHLEIRTPAEALRAAQMKIMQRLREGKLTVGTPAGQAVLPDHPLLWAGFQLMGAP